MNAIQEIVFPRVRGVYLLAALTHQYLSDRRVWACSYVYYVGESNDLAQRLLAHRSGRECISRFGDDPRMVLLTETNRGREARRNSEKKFMAAAIKLGIHLVNKSQTLPSPIQIEKWKLTCEIAQLKEAVNFLLVPASPWRYWSKHKCPALQAIAA